MGQSAATLAERIRDRRAEVAVVGLGYVGLPVAATFLEAGFCVRGIDLDSARVARLAAGESDPAAGAAADTLSKAVAEGRFHVTDDTAALAASDAILLCLPTPLGPADTPDLAAVTGSAAVIASGLRPGQLVCLESTTYPGTTDEILLPGLAASGLRCGEDFFVAYSPERIDPGRKGRAIADIPKIVGGVDPASTDLAATLYRAAFREVVIVDSARVAEAVKLTENVFRAVNIALVNELKQVFQALGIDIWDVLAAAETKPFGFMRFDPGPGFGGHCIPIDPFYLAWAAERAGERARFVELAGRVNAEMPDFVVKRLAAALLARGRGLAGARVLLLGLAYKRDIADARESPGFAILDRLLDAGAQVSYHDPLLAVAPPTRRRPHLAALSSVLLDAATLAEADAIVLVTDHSTVDYEFVHEHARLIIDTRGLLPRSAKVVRA